MSSKSESAIFVADVHLSGEYPARTERFLRFLDTHGKEVDVIFILGDLFDFWIGPTDARLAEHRAILDKLKGLARGGRQLIFFAGNRDFYACDYLGRELGILTISDQQIFAVGGKRLFLTHGEQLWERSAVDRYFSGLLKTRQMERLLTSLPVRLGEGLARAYNNYSRHKNRRNQRELVLVESMVLSAFKRGADALVCGHAHKAMHRSYLVEGSRRELFVLDSWHRRGSFLELTDGHFGTTEV